MIKEGKVKREEGIYFLSAGFYSHRKTKLTFFFEKKYGIFPSIEMSCFPLKKASRSMCTFMTENIVNYFREKKIFQ